MTVLFKDPSKISQGQGFLPWGARQGTLKFESVDAWWTLTVYEYLRPGSTCAMRFPG